MSLKPCATCGEPTTSTRCPEHQSTKAPPVTEQTSARARGYTHAWDLLSKRARRLQPFCSDCNATDDLTTDHSPEAWRRVEAGLPSRLQDVDVVCMGCNNRRGPARGERVREDNSDPCVKPQEQLTLQPYEVEAS